MTTLDYVLMGLGILFIIGIWIYITFSQSTYEKHVYKKKAPYKLEPGSESGSESENVKLSDARKIKSRQNSKNEIKNELDDNDILDHILMAEMLTDDSSSDIDSGGSSYSSGSGGSSYSSDSGDD